MGYSQPSIIGFMYFNSQPHKEADPESLRAADQKGYFNSQPHKEADGSSIKGEIYEGNFNSQPHKEADKVGRKHNRTCRISTHSLTRRLTENKKENGK